jgi:hypothetical protein
MLLTHNVKELKNNTEFKKSKFEKIKDFVKRKSLLLAVPAVLVFSTPMFAQETKVSYEEEQKEKEVTVNVNKDIKDAYAKYKDNKISMDELRVIVFKQVYSQLRETDFPRIQLSNVVDDLIEKLDSMEPELLSPVKKTTPPVKSPIKARAEKTGEVSVSEVIGEIIDRKEEEKEVEEEKQKAEEQEKAEEQVEKVKEAKEVKSEKNLTEILKEAEETFVRKDISEEVVVEEQVKEEQVEQEKAEQEKAEQEKVEVEEQVKEKVEEKEKEKVVVKPKTEEELDDIEGILDQIESRHQFFISQSTLKQKPENKYSWVFDFELKGEKMSNSLPSVDNRGVEKTLLGSDATIKLITPSGIGFNLTAGYSGEFVDFINNIHNTRDLNVKNEKYNDFKNHLAKMLLGLSYNTKDFSMSLMGGYKLGKLYSSNVLGRDKHYPFIQGDLILKQNQFTRLKFEVPFLFNEGQNLITSLDHISKYLFISSNLNFSKESSIMTTSNNNTIRNTYPMLNTQNFLGAGFYSFNLPKSNITPILFLVGNYTGMNADNLQKVKAWSLGPGIGATISYNDSPIMGVGYGYGMGKYFSKYTDLEGVNSFNLNSSYSTHNMLIRFYIPVSDNLNIYSEFNFLKGDAKGDNGIRSPMNDYSKFLLFFNYNF